MLMFMVNALYTAVSTITSIVAVNYWRHAIKGYRRTADLIIAKLSFTVYFVIGLMYVRDQTLLMIGIPMCVLIIAFYSLSNYFWS